MLSTFGMLVRRRLPSSAFWPRAQAPQRALLANRESGAHHPGGYRYLLDKTRSERPGSLQVRVVATRASFRCARCAHAPALRAVTFVIEDGTASGCPMAPASDLWRNYRVLEVGRVIRSFAGEEHAIYAFRLQC